MAKSDSSDPADQMPSPSKTAENAKPGASAQERQLRGERLLRAASRGDTREAARLLAAGADPRAVDERGKTALMLSAEAQSLECLRLLLPVSDAGAVDETGRSALSLVAQTKGEAALACVAFLAPKSPLETRAVGGLTPLHEAAIAGAKNAVAALLRAGADPKARSDSGETPLMLAARRSGSLALDLVPVSDLLAVNAEGLDALAAAAQAGCPGAVAALAPLCDPERRGKDGRTALMRAASATSVSCVKALLPFANPKAADPQGRTALMIAALQGRPLAVEALAPVSDAWAKDPSGKTALDLAQEAQAASPFATSETDARSQAMDALRRAMAAQERDALAAAAVQPDSPCAEAPFPIPRRPKAL
jgi:ankyrin repeat protein